MTLAPETTVYVSGLSKSIATGLRVGFVAAPSEWVSKIERSIRVTTWNTPGVMTAIACGWLDNGTVARLESEKRRDATIRQAVVTTVLQGLQYVRHPASYFVWLPLPEGARADRVAMALMRERISASTAEPFATYTPVPHAIRLALGSVELGTLRHALAKVKRVIDDQAYWRSTR
jgi:DNA-binding transcriptional MocR family regulator